MPGVLPDAMNLRVKLNSGFLQAIVIQCKMRNIFAENGGLVFYYYFTGLLYNIWLVKW